MANIESAHLEHCSSNIARQPDSPRSNRQRGRWCRQGWGSDQEHNGQRAATLLGSPAARRWSTSPASASSSPATAVHTAPDWAPRPETVRPSPPGTLDTAGAVPDVR